MKFTVLPLHLKAAFKSVSSVIVKNPAMPVLTNILVKPLSEKQLSFTASDGENTVSVPISVEESSDVVPFLLPAHNLGQFVANLGEWPVTFEVVKSELCVSDVFGEFKFVIDLDVAVFPVMPEVADAETYSLPADQLVDAAQVALHLVGNDNMRPQMTGVCFNFRRERGLVIAACDQKRLFCDTIPDIPVGEDSVVIVPKIVINALTSLVSTSGDASVLVSVSSKVIRFEQGDIVIVGRLIDGKYPRFEAIIPKTNDRIAVLSRALLGSAIKRAAIAADTSTGQIRFSFDGKNSLEVSARDIEYSTSSSVRISTDSQANLDAGLVLGLRGSYILDVLSTLRSSDKVTFMMSDPARAVLVKPSVDASRIILVMPMQLNA